MNSVILIGRLARDPELSYTPNTQKAVCRFTIAVDRPRRQGEDQGADFIRITVWDRQAESCKRYLAKGRQVAIMGRIQTGSYKNQSGETVYTTDVVADRVEFLGSNNSNGNGNGGGGNSRYGDAPQSAPAQAANVPPQQMSMADVPPADMPDSFQEAEDDIPF